MITSKKTRNAAPDKQRTQRPSATKPIKKSRRSATKNAAERTAQPSTKQAALVALLERPAGATIVQMCAKIGWQAHSVRAALTGLRKRGLAISRDKNNAGTTVYRVGEASK